MAKDKKYPRENLKKKGPGRPKDENKSQAIMDAASKLFMSKGIAYVTMDDIAAEAGVSKLTIYNHMGTKEKLFEAMIRSKCENHMNEDLFDSLDCQDARADLEKIGHGFVDIIYSPQGLAMHRTVMSEARNGYEIPKLFYKNGPQSVFDYLVKYLERLEKISMLKFPDKRRAADIFFSLFQGDTHMKVALGIEDVPNKKVFNEFVKDNVSVFLKMYISV